MRTQAEWNVDTHIFRATGPTRAATRPFISSAALLVNVMARISKGDTPWSLISHATLDVSTRVLPDPAPATISSGPPGWVTASRWTGLRLARRSGGGIGGPQPTDGCVCPKECPTPVEGLPAGASAGLRRGRQARRSGSFVRA